ncbi:tRNA:m(4)X modification enzyme Trm13p [Monosporozyma servazzii]
MMETKPRLQCKYFLKKKNRQCGMTRSTQQDYCSEHLILLPNSSDNSIEKDVIDRIPCPLDPKHTVNKNQLQRHLKKCNKFKLNHINDNMSYYKLDLNTATTKSNNNNNKFQLNDTLINKTIDILYLYQNSNDNTIIPTMVKQNQFMSNTRFNILKNQKHAIQQSSLIQNLLEFRHLNDHHPLNILEYGAGRAEFSRYCNQVFQSLDLNVNKFVLIDRASNRLKFDNKIISDSKTAPIIKRVKIDIKDLFIDDLLSPNEQNIIISKHLCGVATDLTLRSIVNNPILSGNVDSICIAMCCRHVCDPNQYINVDFMKNILNQYGNNTLSYHEFFSTLTKLCSWATNGKRSNIQDCDTVEITNERTVSIKERENIGLMARYLIDQGRLEWVKSNIPNSKAQLIKYVSSDISLENVALFLTK